MSSDVRQIPEVGSAKSHTSPKIQEAVGGGLSQNPVVGGAGGAKTSDLLQYLVEKPEVPGANTFH